MKLLFKRQKILTNIFIIATLGANSLGFMGAYLLTNYKSTNSKLFGWPRPGNYQLPPEVQLKYDSQHLAVSDRQWIDTWLLKSVIESQGTVILFHGKNSNKGSLLESAKVFNELGYDALLVDFPSAINHQQTKIERVN